MRLLEGARRCDQCGGAMPARMSRQRNDKGQLVCDGCKGLKMPEWSTTHASLDVAGQAEMRRREQEAVRAISRVARMQREGHDSGDNAVINHCPFCGSGAVVGGSDGSVSCNFCHSNFTVQVQPSHPHMPQTIDGVPTTPPGMPGGQETEMSAPEDPAVSETQDGAATDPLGDADPAASNGPVKPGQPPSKQPAPFTKADPSTNPGKGEDGDKDKDPKGKSKPPWLKSKSFRTSTGATLTSEAYLAHLALEHADDRDAVLDLVRMQHQAAEERNADLDRLAHGVDCPRCQAYADTPCKTRRSGSETHPHRERIDRAVRLYQKRKESSRKVECPDCGGAGENTTGEREHDTGAYVTHTCPRCDGSGEVDADAPENFELREPPHEGSMRPFEAAGGSLTKHQVRASEIKVGDYLDISGKSRVHTVHPRGERVLLGFKTRGARSGSTRAHQQDEMVNVWRKP